VEQTVDPATGIPSSDAAVSGGSFFGIPYGWPLAAAIVGVILLMWIARHPVRQVLWQVFFITGRVFGRWGLWLGEHGRAARITCSEKIASHRADELQERMLMLEDRVGHRAEKLPKETTPIVARLDKSTHELATVAGALSEINLEDTAERAFRAAMPSIEQGRNLSKLEKNIAQNTARSMNDRLVPIRPALKALQVEAPRLKDVADKLSKIDQRFNQSVEQVNKSFSEFEMIMKSEDRVKVASRASIVIPWLIALLIMTIALSGVFLNFFLIERPMAEIVGEGARIAGVGLPTFAALIVIFLEFVTGVILMDSLGFTKLIPAFETMSDRGKKLLAGIAFVFLTAFSVLEISLSIVREQIIEQQQETRDLANAALISPSLAPAPAAPSADASEPVATTPAPAQQRANVFGLELSTFAQVILAAIIPWLLAAAALPLETIIRNSVFMVSIASSYAMLLLAFIFKTIAVLFKNVGLFVLTVYDLIIFAPLAVERMFKGGGGGSKRSQDRNARKKMRKDRADDEAEGEGRNQADDDLMVLEEPVEEQPPSRRDRRQRELQRA
jgi:hypothetical protein